MAIVCHCRRSATHHPFLQRRRGEHFQLGRASFVAADAYATFLSPPHIVDLLTEGCGTIERPKCEFILSICMNFVVKMKNNNISHPSPPPSLRLQPPTLRQPPPCLILSSNHALIIFKQQYINNNQPPQGKLSNHRQQQSYLQATASFQSTKQ